NQVDNTVNITSTPTSVEDIRHNLVQHDRPQIFVPPFFSNIFNKGATAAETQENAAKAGILPLPVRKFPELQESQHPMQQTKMMVPKTALPKYQPYFVMPPFPQQRDQFNQQQLHNPYYSGPQTPAWKNFSNRNNFNQRISQSTEKPAEQQWSRQSTDGGAPAPAPAPPPPPPVQLQRENNLYTSQQKNNFQMPFQFPILQPYPFWSLLQKMHSNNMHNLSPSGPAQPRTYGVDKTKLQNQNLFENGMNFIPGIYPMNNIKPWPVINSQPNAMPMLNSRPSEALLQQFDPQSGLFFEKPETPRQPPQPPPPPPSPPRPILNKQFQYPVPQFELPKPKPTPPTFILRTQLPPMVNFKSVNEMEDKQQHQHTQMINYLDQTNSIVNPETRPVQYQMEPPLLNVDDMQQPMKTSAYYHQPSSSINNDSTTYMLSLEQSPINFCNPLEFNEQVLASLNLKRVDYFIANMSCSSVFFQCSMQTTFVRRCAGADQVFDETTVNCNYRHSVKSCLEYDHVLHCTIKNQCLSDEYACCAAPQQCIPYAKRCDGIVDCADGEDENNCPTCSINEFPCLIGGTCIPMERRCNGMPDDCFDNSNADEKYCEYCGVGKFYCYKSDPNYEFSCIDANQRCDGVKDCQGGEDELNCKRQGAQFLLCENQRQSVPRKQWCDGNEDCADGSDEIYCEY
ncbi:Sortilin-related receptor, partial [Trichinella papuae]